MSLYKRPNSRYWWPRSAYRTGAAYAALVAQRKGKERKNGSTARALTSGASAVSANVRDDGSRKRRASRFILPEAKRRGRWLNKEEATRLFWIAARHGFMLMKRKVAGMPLNDEAVAVLREELGKHPLRVFTYKGRPPAQANARAWWNALKRAGIKNFRWHDLRHVWATWHVMARTTMAELQELGAWKSTEMVRRYAHFAPEQLRAAANKLATFSYTPRKRESREPPQAIE